MKTILNNIKIIVIALLIAVGASYASAAWTGPTGDAPKDNVLPPINVSGIGQSKTGSILSGTLFAAPEFCIIDPSKIGDPNYKGDCISSWGSGGSGGGGAQGSLCGLYVDREGQETGGRLRVSCQGHNPKDSCPSGYEKIWGNTAGFGGQEVKEWYMCASTSGTSGGGSTETTTTSSAGTCDVKCTRFIGGGAYDFTHCLKDKFYPSEYEFLLGQRPKGFGYDNFCAPDGQETSKEQGTCGDIQVLIKDGKRLCPVNILKP